MDSKLRKRPSNAACAAKRKVFMKVYPILLRIALGALCVLSSVPLSAQNKKKWTAAEIVAYAKPGQWVEIDGAIQKDQSVVVVEIEFPAGDFMDNDWRLLAKVSAVDTAKEEFRALWIPVKVTKDTEFEEGLKSFGDLKPEMLVKLEGTYLNNGMFLAKEIDDRARKLKAEPQFHAMLELVGKIAQVDEAKRTITVMGIQFQITEETEGKSPIK